MKYVFAPLEGITGYIFRNAFDKYFGPVDEYYSPFLAPAMLTGHAQKAMRDLNPDNNKGKVIIPQLITKNSEHFIKACKVLREYGYTQVNLNLGCPSRTVVTKGRGSGLLANTEKLDEFLENIFAKSEMKVSIKTRLGISDEEEFTAIMEIYNKYPLQFLTCHPRLQKDYYKNGIRRKSFDYAYNESKFPIGYNGDINTVKDALELQKKYPKLDHIMIGRGFLKNPELLRLIRTENPVNENIITAEYKLRLKNFLDEIIEEYRKELSSDRDALFRMKELWTYLSEEFLDYPKQIKVIRKTNTLSEYMDSVKIILG